MRPGEEKKKGKEGKKGSKGEGGTKLSSVYSYSLV